MTDLSLEDILIHEALDYKLTSGASGDQLNIKECPDCGKAKWKVYANADTSLGNCFSCGENFNVFKFVGWILKQKGGAGTNRDIGAYLNDARKRLGYRPKTAKPKVTIATEEGAFELPFSSPIPDLGGKNHPYLEGRGIDAETAAAFQLRYSMFGWHPYVDPKTGETKKQSFNERIIIPVFNLDGMCVTFQGRDVTGFSDTRYKFAAGLPGTGRYLYNGHTARGLHAKHVLMNEGPTDVMKAAIALALDPELAKIVPIGSFGMKLSESTAGDDQVGAFKKLRDDGLETVTIMWDGEEEAYNSALDAAKLLLKIGLGVRIAKLPFEADPGAASVFEIHQAIKKADPVNRLTLLRLKMNNPYKGLVKGHDTGRIPA